MPLDDFLFPHETIQTSFDKSQMVQYAKTEYNIYFTNQRLVLFAKSGLLLKRENIVSLAYQEIIRLDYKEKGLFKRGIAKVSSPLMNYEFEGDPSVVKALVQNLQKLIPTKVIDTVKERETKIIEKETVLIQCSYCKGLIPQTSVYCPTCGAKRS